jgi:hypothetical protein
MELLNIKKISLVDCIKVLSDGRSISVNNIECLVWIYKNTHHFSHFFVGTSKPAYGCEDANRKRPISSLFQCQNPESFDLIDQHNHELEGIFYQGAVFFLPGNFRLQREKRVYLSMKESIHGNVNPFYPLYHDYVQYWDVAW